MNFEETLKKLKKECSNKIALECMHCMQKEEVFFNSGFVKNTKELTSLYSFRLRNAKNSNIKDFDYEVIKNWKIAIDNLSKCISNDLRLNWVNSNEKTYFLFWNYETLNLEASFYLNSKYSISQKQEKINELIEKGYSNNSVKYLKGNLADQENKIK